jgi:nucleoid-associated protein YgaU
MALNVKAAMLICAAFISGLCWLVSRVTLPVSAAPPLGELSVPMQGGDAAEAATPASGYAAMAGGLNPRFSHRGPLELQPRHQASAAEQATVSTASPAPIPEPGRRVSLPPVARPEAAARSFAAVTPEGLPEPGSAVSFTNAAAEGGAKSAPPGAAEPVGTSAAPAGAAVEPAGPGAARRCQVKKGDSLGKMVQRELKSRDPRVMQLVLAANPKLRSRPNKILLGEQVVIPDAAAVERVLKGVKPEQALAAKPSRAGRATSERLAAGDNAASAKAGSAKASGAKAADGAASEPAVAGSKAVGESKRSASGLAAKTAKWRWYTIRKHDSLRTIAKRMLNDERRWREIAELNGLKDPNKICLGLRIKVPEAPALACR